MNHDSEWRPAAEAVSDGTQCALRFRDALGTHEDIGPFFLHEGHWYRVEPPTKIPDELPEVANA